MRTAFKPSPIVCFATNRIDCGFPDVGNALPEPNGLLAAGGDLKPELLIEAYSKGIFPWYEEGHPILWWSPDPRMVLFPERVKVTRSLRKTLRKQNVHIRFDTAFEEVVRACAEPRKHQHGTWITAAMVDAYCQLHRLGFAHSVEAWSADRLVGGLYGVALGRIFFGESMFSRERDASKITLVYLAHACLHWRYQMIDCQVESEHLKTLGAELIPRRDFVELVARECRKESAPFAWAETVDTFSYQQ